MDAKVVGTKPVETNAVEAKDIETKAVETKDADPTVKLPVYQQARLLLPPHMRSLPPHLLCREFELLKAKAAKAAKEAEESEAQNKNGQGDSAQDDISKPIAENSMQIDTTQDATTNADPNASHTSSHQNTDGHLNNMQHTDDLLHVDTASKPVEETPKETPSKRWIVASEDVRYLPNGRTVSCARLRLVDHDDPHVDLFAPDPTKVIFTTNKEKKPMPPARKDWFTPPADLSNEAQFQDTAQDASMTTNKPDAKVAGSTSTSPNNDSTSGSGGVSLDWGTVPQQQQKNHLHKPLSSLQEAAETRWGRGLRWGEGQWSDPVWTDPQWAATPEEKKQNKGKGKEEEVSFDPQLRSQQPTAEA